MADGRNWGRENAVLLCTKYRVSIVQDENVLAIMVVMVVQQ